MEKKTYMKPSMKVVELRRRQLLLLDSGADAYIPGMREDMNQMA